MTETITAEIEATLHEILSQMRDLAERVARIEKAAAAPAPVARVAPPPPAHVAASSVAAKAGITEEELIAISAAIAAYLGVRAHIRQIRVIDSPAWAQQGRVTVQASHRLIY
jgi:methylmalonyl-CoA carboxyltransferase 12S subunit